MQIVIDTIQCPCRTLNDECSVSGRDCYEDDICSLCPLIMNGGVKLPKGHGRLIDADAFISKMEDASKRQRYKELLIDDLLTVDDVFKAIIESLQNEGLAEGDAPTIIEAEKEESEDKE